MKTKTISLFKKSFMVMLIMVIYLTSFSQEKKKSLTVLNIDTRGINLSPVQAGDLVRLEVEKLSLYDVTDRYDVAWLVSKNDLKVDGCYGKICLLEIAEKINSEKMLTGTIESLGNNYIITLRLIDVKTTQIERSVVNEFLQLSKEIQNMIAISLNDLFQIPADENLRKTLITRHQFENPTTVPYKSALKLDGPRMGFTVLTGNTAEIFKSPESQGGYNGFPAMFQFGYQFEKQYLNEGNFQALFEFIPMVTGLDQGIAIPSLTILHGLRGNKKGWEFAFGPTISLVRKSEGYYDMDGGWNRVRDYNDTIPLAYHTVTRMDKFGDPTLTSGFVFAFGRSFRSGKMNIPFNAYVIPQKDGWRFGASFGFNARK
ncbi:MAG: hypothetical protein ACK4K0_11415 [Flavobacteriales bacterium]